MAPAGVGMLAGIVGLPRLAARWPKEAIANCGILSTGVVLLALGLVGQLGFLPRGSGEIDPFDRFAAPVQTGPVQLYHSPQEGQANNRSATIAPLCASARLRS